MEHAWDICYVPMPLLPCCPLQLHIKPALEGYSSPASPYLIGFYLEEIT